MSELDLPRRRQMLDKARTRLAEIEQAPVSREKDAAKAAALIVGSYPQSRAANPDVYMRQLKAILTGVPMDALMAIVDPRRGILGACAFLPALAEVKAWLDAYQAPRRSLAKTLRAEIETLCDADPERPDRAERERRLRAAAEIVQRQEPAPLRHLEWLKPEADQSAKERAERARFAACQARDRAELANTPLVRAPLSAAEKAA